MTWMRRFRVSRGTYHFLPRDATSNTRKPQRAPSSLENSVHWWRPPACLCGLRAALRPHSHDSIVAACGCKRFASHLRPVRKCSMTSLTSRKGPSRRGQRSPSLRPSATRRATSSGTLVFASSSLTAAACCSQLQQTCFGFLHGVSRSAPRCSLQLLPPLSF